jgi:hypothetical protein
MKANRLLILVTLLFLAACGRFEVKIEPILTAVPTNPAGLPSLTPTIAASPTPQVEPTTTVVIPSPTLAVPTVTQPQQIPPTQPPPASPTDAEQMVKIVLIALEDNGQSGTPVGCGDSAIPINVTIPRTQAVLRAALEKLFSAKQQFYGESGYYNALYQSDLQVAGVTIEQGKATIRLTGTILLGGTCDAPRVQAQIEQTALQFSTVSEVDVFINEVPIEEFLSTR